MQGSTPSAKLGIASAAAGALLWGFSGVCLQFLAAEYGGSSLFTTIAALGKVSGIHFRPRPKRNSIYY